MTNKAKRIFSIVIFFTISILFRFYITKIEPDFYIKSNLYTRILLQGIGPLIGGLFVIKIMNRPNELKILGLNFYKTFLIIGIPITLFFLSKYFITGVFDFNIIKYVGIIILYALFEEFGWRNYLQSELKELHKFIKYFIITVLWFIWHLNFEMSIDNLIFF